MVNLENVVLALYQTMQSHTLQGGNMDPIHNDHPDLPHSMRRLHEATQHQQRRAISTASSMVETSRPLSLIVFIQRRL
jgi:hypothetical protein